MFPQVDRMLGSMFIEIDFTDLMSSLSMEFSRLVSQPDQQILNCMFNWEIKETQNMGFTCHLF